MWEAAKVLLIILPVVLAGIIHSAAIRSNWLPALSKPLDFGLCLGGRPLFGANKTFRGQLLMIAGSAATAWALGLALNAPGNSLQALLPRGFEFMMNPGRAAGLGAVMGLGYALGELPNSFIKRRLDIAPGGNPGGLAGTICYVADQADSVLGVTLLLALLYAPPAEVLLALLAAGSAVHIVFDQCLYLTGVKHRADGVAHAKQAAPAPGSASSLPAIQPAEARLRR